MEFVSCITWIKRGVAKPDPEKIQLSQQELRELIETAQTEAAEQAPDEDGAGTSELPNNPDDEFGLEHYDEEQDRTDMVLGIQNLAVIDPADTATAGDDSDSEKEDEAIKSNDNLIVVGNSQKDWDILKVYVYNEDDDDFYVHHDIMLNSCPLCIEWMDLPIQNERSNFIAVGLMTPVIDVWDLDIINPVEPFFTLGYKSEKKNHSHRNIGHKEAVLDLSWNVNFPHILASGSADKTALLWDLETRKPSTTISNFSHNVESLEWHSQEGQTLLAGSADTSVKVFDCRYENTFRQWKVDGEALVTKWNVWQPFNFVVGTSTGRIYGMDVRSNEPVWVTEPHEKDITSLEMAHSCNGLLVSAYVDGIVKVWDIKSSPIQVFSQELFPGQLHAFALNPDSPYIGGIGGIRKNKSFKLINLQTIKEVMDHFSQN